MNADSIGRSASGHHHTSSDSLPDKKTIVLAGNPNVGKSLIFNYLSGLYVEVSNYPGTTVEITESRFNQDRLLDTPGIYSVASYNDEERVARAVILEADIVINVVDAVHLERDLFLTLQLIDMGIPLIVALNFMDELKKEGIQIDIEKLEKLLGVPVLPTSAVNKEGLEVLAESIPRACRGIPDAELHKRLINHLTEVGSLAEALLLLEGDPETAREHGTSAGHERESIYLRRRQRVNAYIEEAFQTSDKKSFREILSRLTLHPFSGLIIILVVLYGLYQIIGVGIAQYVVGFSEDTLGKEYYEPLMQSFIARYAAVDISLVENVITESGEEKMITIEQYFFPNGTRNEPLVYQNLRQKAKTDNKTLLYTYDDVWAIFLAGPFGILTMTVTYLLFLLLPLVVAFYICLSLLEDCGYLPRLATMTDALLNKIGLNGRAVIPLLLGFGCVTLATITTRLLTTQREKTIATAILNFAIPCSAQLAVITALLTKAGGWYVLAFVLILFVALILLGTLLNWILPGRSSPLLIDLPSLRLPRFDNIVRKTFFKSYHFMKEAIPFFVIGSLIVTLLQVTSMLDAWESLFLPITTKWLLLPPESATAFIMGLIRRDFGAAGFFQIDLTATQILTGLITLTFFVPCIASMMILFKERGSQQALMIWFGSWFMAFLIGGIIARIF